MKRIDLNADCEEGFDDAGLMQYVLGEHSLWWAHGFSRIDGALLHSLSRLE